MQLFFHKTFVKQLKKLSRADQDKVRRCMQLFMIDPYHPTLRNHALRGKYKGYRSIDVRPDLRALYVVLDSETVEFVLLGTHSQLY